MLLAMSDVKFACPHCEQHIKCDERRGGETIACPACGQNVVVPAPADQRHLRISTGRVPRPAHAHGAPRDATVELSAKSSYSPLAIASIAFSCASPVLWPFGFVPGIILGYLAKAELRRNPGLRGAELATAGIWVGYGFLALSALLLGLWLVLRAAAPR
jgi:hypothetical protein